MKKLGLLTLLLFTFNTYAADAPSACVPSKGLSVGGISMADTRATAMSKLGKPKTTTTYQGEDDGGQYTGTTLIYPYMELNVDELRGIERIAGTGPSAKFPFGLKAGMSLQQAANLLHFVPGALDRGAVVLPVCAVDVDTEFQLRFADGGLVSVELRQYGP